MANDTDSQRGNQEDDKQAGSSDDSSNGDRKEEGRGGNGKDGDKGDKGEGKDQGGNDEGKDQGDKGQGDDKGQGGGSKKQKVDPRRKRTIRLVVLAILVVAIIAAIPIWAYYSVRESTDDAQVDGHVVAISSRISGNVLSVLVNDNQQIRAGQELIRLDPADYQVALAQAEAQLANAEASTIESKVNLPVTDINTSAQVKTSLTQSDESRATVASSQQAVNAARGRLSASISDLAQAQANYVRSQKDLIRYKDLVQKDEISRQEYDSALAAAEANAAQVESAKATIAVSQHTLDQSNAELDAARARLATSIVQQRQSQDVRPKQILVSEARYKSSEAQVKQRQADLDQAKLNVGYTLLRAPIDGMVSRKTAEPGMQISAGQQMMALIPLDDIWVTANFKETQLRSMRVGQRAIIEVDTYGSSRKYVGHIDSIAAASGARFSLLPPENATGNFVKVVQRIPVKIVLEPGENRDRTLRPGMSVVPTVMLNSGTNNAY